MRWLDFLIDFFHDKYPSAERLGVPVARWRQSIYRTVFETNTPMGKRFEKRLTVAIVLSLCVVIAHSIPSIAQGWVVYGLRTLEWLFTLAFTVEYGLRLISVRRPWRYVLSFYGLVDLLAIIPGYLSLFHPEYQFLGAIRALRLVRTFHVFPILRGFLEDYFMLGRALKHSARKIFVFLSVVAVIVFVMGALIFVIEGPEHGFTSMPMGMYWAISTVTTVGYGDVTPSTPLGKIFASAMMLVGWSILAVPTGIVGVELSRGFGTKPCRRPLHCETCGEARHEDDARFCRRCGTRLTDARSEAEAGTVRAAAPDVGADGAGGSTASTAGTATMAGTAPADPAAAPATPPANDGRRSDEAQAA
jgi:voltage-gated potassium channel